MLVQCGSVHAAPIRRVGVYVCVCGGGGDEDSHMIY